jgi:hypothetical protein
MSTFLESFSLGITGYHGTNFTYYTLWVGETSRYLSIHMLRNQMAGYHQIKLISCWRIMPDELADSGPAAMPA